MWNICWHDHHALLNAFFLFRPFVCFVSWGWCSKNWVMTSIMCHCVLDMQNHLKIHNFIRGYWVSGLIKQFFIGIKLFSSYTVTYEKLSVFILFLRRVEISAKKINQKPNISSCSIINEVVKSYVWYQATLTVTSFQKCRSNLIICLFLFGFHWRIFLLKVFTLRSYAF